MSYFKKCSHCEEKWETREQFLADNNIYIIGYQVNFRDLKLGMFLFNHLRCKTTLALEAMHFTDFYDGPILKVRKTNTESCPSYCLDKNELSSCPSQCECSYVREVIQTVKNWTKDNGKLNGQDKDDFRK